MDMGLFAEEHRRKTDFLRQCGRYRLAAEKFLTYGDLLQPLNPDGTVPTFEEDGFGWATRHRATVPLAEGRLWRAEDGHLGVILANYDDQPVTFAYSIDPAEHGLKGGKYELQEIGLDGVVKIGAASGRIVRKEVIPAASIRVIEIAPQGKP